MKNVKCKMMKLGREWVFVYIYSSLQFCVLTLKRGGGMEIAEG
jgi:hypothetical protein